MFVNTQFPPDIFTYIAEKTETHHIYFFINSIDAQTGIIFWGMSSRIEHPIVIQDVFYVGSYNADLLLDMFLEVKKVQIIGYDDQGVSKTAITIHPAKKNGFACAVHYLLTTKLSLASMEGFFKTLHMEKAYDTVWKALFDQKIQVSPIIAHILLDKNHAHRQPLLNALYEYLTPTMEINGQAFDVQFTVSDTPDEKKEDQE